jgi:probable rRNA maturation factor
LEINFFCEDCICRFNVKRAARRVIEKIGNDGQKKIETVNIIFCSDEYLIQINRQYLQHDYYTDILTFPYSTDTLHGDLFISVDRVKENAQELHLLFNEELMRVIIHGVLHLLGFKDNNQTAKKIMSAKEDEYLNFFKDICYI